MSEAGKKTSCGKRITPFGAVEDPTIPLSLKGKKVLRIDTLTCLKELWGENILLSRKHLYKMVSGNATDAEFQKLVASYYRRFAAFANYCDRVYLFEDQGTPLTTRIIKPCREKIEAHMERCVSKCEIYQGKYLGSNKDYAYFEFATDNIPNMEGGEVL